jgi:hypothetical protein
MRRKRQRLGTIAYRTSDKTTYFLLLPLQSAVTVNQFSAAKVKGYSQEQGLCFRSRSRIACCPNLACVRGRNELLFALTGYETR